MTAPKIPTPIALSRRIIKLERRLAGLMNFVFAISNELDLVNERLGETGRDARQQLHIQLRDLQDAEPKPRPRRRRRAA